MNDELFRRAAENYPLKTDGANWEALRARMESAVPDDDQQETGKRRKYRWLLLLLLLIPFIILENRFHTAERLITGKTGEPAKTGSAQTSATTPADNEQQQNLQDHNNTVEDQSPLLKDKQEQQDITSAGTMQPPANGTSGANNKPVESLQPASTNASQNNPAANSEEKSATAKSTTKISTQKQKAGLAISAGTTAEDGTGVKTQPKTRPGKKIHKAAGQNESTGGGNELAAKNRATKKTKQKQQVSIQAGSTETEEPTALVDKKETVNIDKQDKEPVKETALVTEDPVKDNNSVEEKKQETKPLAKEESKKEPAVPDSAIVKKDKEKQPFRRYFYAGLVIAPDFSMIKMQSVKRVGLNFGLLVGYRFSKRFSVETGLLYDKKYYETAGKYYNPKGVTLPPNTWYGDVKGGCNMWEIPVNLTYNFWQKPKSGWFASFGASSYFMKKESYDYDVVYSSTYSHHYSKSYKSKETGAFAVINVGAGYTRKLGKIADLRIEPYFRLPVRKIGTGNMPIQSAGIFIGLTRSFY